MFPSSLISLVFFCLRYNILKTDISYILSVFWLFQVGGQNQLLWFLFDWKQSSCMPLICLFLHVLLQWLRHSLQVHFLYREGNCDYFYFLHNVRGEIFCVSLLGIMSAVGFSQITFWKLRNFSSIFGMLWVTNFS